MLPLPLPGRLCIQPPMQLLPARLCNTRFWSLALSCVHPLRRPLRPHPPVHLPCEPRYISWLRPIRHLAPHPFPHFPCSTLPTRYSMVDCVSCKSTTTVTACSELCSVPLVSQMLTIWNFEKIVSMSLSKTGRITPIKSMPFIRPLLPLPHLQTNLFPRKNLTLPTCPILVTGAPK
jgi:hypothetical protein